MNTKTKLLNEFKKLREEEKNLKRCLDIKYYDDYKRTEMFDRLKQCKKDIEKVKFKMRMEKKLNENSNTTKSSN